MMISREGREGKRTDLNREPKMHIGISSFVWFVLIASLFAGFAANLKADVGRAGQAGSALRMGLGARELAMAGGSAALADDGMAVYSNPAGLVFLEGRWVTLDARLMALDRSQFFAGYAQSLGRQNTDGKRQLRAGFSIAWLASTVGNIDGRDFEGRSTGTFSNWEHCFFFSFALNPSPKVAFGVSGKLLYDRFPGITDKGEAMTGTGFGFDAGLMIRPHPRITIGLILRDLRSAYTWDSQKMYERGTQTVDDFPKSVRAGIAFLPINRLLVTADVEKIDGYPYQPALGGEYECLPGLIVRTGIKKGGPTFGFGYRFRGLGRFIRLDYAFAPDPVAPSPSHVFTWSFVF